MKISKNKNMLSAIAVLMILSFVVSMIASTDIANAQTLTTKRNAYPFVFTSPSQAGVGQPVKVNFGLTNNLARDGDGWNVTLKITDPDGKVENIKRKTWSTGYTMTVYTPTKIGNYTLQCLFPETTYDASVAALRGIYQETDSEEVILEVTEEWKPTYPGHNMPTEYWTRPIDGQLREWASISGSWVAKTLNRYAEYNDAPRSPHVLWAQPAGNTVGGLTGGDSWHSVQSGDAYEGRWTNPTILAGILFYDKYQSGNPTQAVVAINVRTGEKLWEKTFAFGPSGNVNRIATGQILRWDSMNSHGTWEYLWIGTTSSTDLYAVEPATGEYVFSMTNIPNTSRFYYGDRGELLKYAYYTNGTFLQWNQSALCVAGSATDNDPSWGSAIRGRTFDSYSSTYRRGYDINISIASHGIFGSLIYVFPGDKAIFGSTGAQPGDGNITLSAISLKPGSEGNLLYKNVVWDAPESFSDILGESYRQSDWTAVSEESQVLVYWEKNTRINYCFDTETGRYMWATEPQIHSDSWMAGTMNLAVGCYNFAIVVYDKLITASIGGVVYCYDIKTGNKLWDYPAKDMYGESYITENWWLTPVIASNGMVYFGTEEHSVVEPKPRGAPFFALDVETGDIVWQIHGMFRQSQWGGQALMGDSVIITSDSYNQMIYAIGRGPSEMTVSVSSSVATAGTPVLISGTVMDVSPGVKDDRISLRFPHGVPAVSDESMDKWMLYVYKEFDLPYETQGLTVEVFATDGNNNIHIGTAVSDIYGRFSVTWTNPAEGDYDIIAYTDMTESYFGSTAKTEMAVTAAPEVPQDNTPAYEWYIIGMGIAIIAVVLIIGLLILKKK